LLNPRIKDLSNKKFGKLLAIKYVGSNKHRCAMWECLCDCGNTKIISCNNLMSGCTESCGCKKMELDKWKQRNILCNIPRNTYKYKKPPGEGLFHKIYVIYRSSTIKRNMEFQLNKDQFRELINGNCYICGNPPSKILRYPKKYRGEYIWNGIDRVDNSIGYIISNCKSCCERCNKAKNAMSLEEFKSFVLRAYNHLIKG
jgi:hypothetical protein